MRNTSDPLEDPNTTTGHVLRFAIERVRRPFMTEAEFLAALAGRPIGGFLFAAGEIVCFSCARRDRKVIVEALRDDAPSPYRPTGYMEAPPAGSRCWFCPCTFCGCRSCKKRPRTACGKDSR